MLTLTHVPLLGIQRDLYAIPRGMPRFQQYLAILGAGSDDVTYPPLVVCNPMARDHVPAFVDTLLAIDAEAVAREAVTEAEERLAAVPVSLDLKVGMAVADDVGGGWTSRAFIELGYLVGKLPDIAKRPWVTAILWASDPPTRDMVRRAVLSAVYGNLEIKMHGVPRTLAEVMDFVGRAGVFAGATTPRLDRDDLDYSRAVLAEWLHSTDVPRIFSGIHGDSEAKRAGYDPLGLSPSAGIAVALDRSRNDPNPPEFYLNPSAIHGRNGVA